MNIFQKAIDVLTKKKQKNVLSIQDAEELMNHGFKIISKSARARNGKYYVYIGTDRRGMTEGRLSRIEYILGEYGFKTERHRTTHKDAEGQEILRMPLERVNEDFFRIPLEIENAKKLLYSRQVQKMIRG